MDNLQRLDNILIRAYNPPSDCTNDVPRLLISHLGGDGKRHFQVPINQESCNELAKWIESRKKWEDTQTS